MVELPFAYRLLILLGVLAVAAALDRARYGAQARRAQEYGLLLLCGALGGLFGLAQDIVISAPLSPDYFELAKGIRPGQGFLWEVAELGFHAGFLGGVVVGGGLLIANQPRPDRRPLPQRRVLRLGISVVPALALGGSVCGALLVDGIEPAWLQELASFLPAPRARALRVVWGLHTGLYAGALLGLAIAVWAVRRARLSRGGTDPDPAA